MIRSRVFPVLLLRGSGLIKTKQFKHYKYLGDVINTIKIFNELNVDELCVFGLDPYQKSQPIDFFILKKISREANMPLCYGGGISSVEEAKRLIDAGFEKISLNSMLYNNIDVVSGIIKEVGAQSVVATIDYRVNSFGKMLIYSNCGNKQQDIKVEKLIDVLNDIGVSEVIFQNIDKDGMRNGFDLERLSIIKDKLTCQMSILGGCNSSKDIETVDLALGPVGIGVASSFVFNGRLDAVLISYDRGDVR